MPKVLIIPAATEISASSRYRVYQFLEPLRQMGFHLKLLTYPSRPTSSNRLGYFLRLAITARRVDVVFIQKRLFPRFLPLLHKLNPRIIYDFDDALFSPQSAQAADSSSAPRPVDNRFFDQTLKLCAHIIAGNEYLAAYARRLNPRVTIIPTVVDPARYPVRPLTPTQTTPITLGWVGNGENLVYLTDLLPVFRHLVARFGQKIRLHVISDERPPIPGDIPFHFELWQLERETESLLAFDIGLMPLRDDAFTRGKCAFKAIQYMAAAIPAIASPVGANAALIEHNHNGLLANSEAEWVEHLTSLIEDESLRARLGLAGRETVVARYSPAAALPRLANVLRKVAQQ